MDNVIDMAALGRPFSLGMLYDCRSDTAVPGVTLWDREELDKITVNRERDPGQGSSRCSVIAGNEEGDKFESLGVSADVKLSVMSGKVKVHGAAEYLNTKKSTAKSSSVTLHYSTITKFEQMNMEQLGVGNMKHVNVLDAGTATHVVTGIQYGADVFLEFSKSFDENDTNQNIQGNLEIVIDKISALAVEGQGAFNFDERQHSLIDKLKCSFSGDIALKTPPTTFSEAVAVYKQIPELVGQGKPQRVWLYPLVKLDSRAQKLVRHISDDVVGKLTKYMAALSDSQVRAKDLKSEDTCKNFYRLRSQLDTLYHQVENCDSKFKHEILPILPRVRGGSAEEKELLEVLQRFEESQFAVSRLATWLDSKEREIKVLNRYSQSLKAFPFATRPGELDGFVNSLDYNFVYALTFTLGDVSDAYLEAQTAFFRNSGQSANDSSGSQQPWFENDNIKQQMMVATRHFMQAADYHKNGKVKFIVTEKLQQQPEGMVLMLYADALGRRYDVPGRPSTPTSAGATDTVVCLEWKFSEFGPENVLGSEVQMLVCQEDPPAWRLAKKIEGSKSAINISNLAPNGRYKFKIVPLSIMGQGPESEESDVIVTKPPQIERLAMKLVQQSELVKLGVNGCPTKYLLPGKEIFRDEERNIRKVIIGHKAHDSASDQILMLMGATGAGKTTLLNAFANYYYGVKWKDNFRFVVVNEKEKSQAESQTKTITAYSFEPMEGAAVPYRTIIVDTPGFGDTAGLQEDKKTVQKIKEFFSKPGNEGISHLNGVGFVVQAPLARLTPSQKFVFDQILAIFGKNMAKSIFLMITFADGQAPPVLEGVKAAGINYQDKFCFNNSSLFANNSLSGADEELDFAEMFWKMGNSAMKHFFTKFYTAPLVSLAMTIEVLNLRNSITTALQGLNSQITLGLSYLEEIVKDEAVMELHKAEIEGGKNFEYTVEETQVVEKSIAGTGEFTTHCLSCNFTCHYPCKISDANKFHCYTMYRDMQAIADDLSKDLGKTVTPDDLNLSGRQSACTCHSVMEGEKGYCNCWYGDPNRTMVDALNAMFRGNYVENHTRCGSCPGKCHYNKHKNVEFVIEYRKVPVKHTNEDLLKKYKQGKEKFNSVQEMLASARKQFDDVRNHVIHLIYQVKENLMKLDEIAQRRNPLTCVDYIELLIQSEKEEMKPGWEERIKHLDDAKQQARLIDQIQKDEFTPWEKYEKEMVKKKGKKWYNYIGIGN